MAFHDVLFPIEISYGSRGGPQFKTTILTLASGHERRNQDWQLVQGKYDVSHGIKEPEDMKDLREFFYGRRGSAHSFRFLDHADNEIDNQTIGFGNGVKATFQIIKSYDVGVNQYDRTITKPVPGSLVGLTVNSVLKTPGVHFNIDYNTGIVTFTGGNIPASGHAVTIIGLNFHVHARFDTDHLDASHDFFNIQSWESIPVLEVKGTA